MLTVQKLQTETFLVMSLKKQLRDQKAELQRKEEELDAAKKNAKHTQKTEMDAELGTWLGLELCSLLFLRALSSPLSFKISLSLSLASFFAFWSSLLRSCFLSSRSRRF